MNEMKLEEQYRPQLVSFPDPCMYCIISTRKVAYTNRGTTHGMCAQAINQPVQPCYSVSWCWPENATAAYTSASDHLADQQL